MVLTSNASSSAAASRACENCKMEDQLLVNNIRFPNKFSNTCTTCVLRLNIHSFCPTCYRIYPPPPPADAAVNCFKCGSLSHSRCVDLPHPELYICPFCVYLRAKSKMKEQADFKGFMFLDRETLRKVVAAAKIVTAILNKAAAEAKAELERKASKVVLLKKRATKAMELLDHLLMEEKSGGKASTSMAI